MGRLLSVTFTKPDSNLAVGTLQPFIDGLIREQIGREGRLHPRRRGRANVCHLRRVTPASTCRAWTRASSSGRSSWMASCRARPSRWVRRVRSASTWNAARSPDSFTACFLIVILAGCTQPALEYRDCRPTPGGDPAPRDTARSESLPPPKSPLETRETARICSPLSDFSLSELRIHRQQPICPFDHRRRAGWRSSWGRFRLLHPSGNRKSHAGGAHPGSFARAGGLGDHQTGCPTGT